MTDFSRLQELFGSGLVLTHRCPAVVVYPSDVPVTSFVCSVCFRLFVRWQLFRMCCRGFYRCNSGLGFGDRGCGLGGLRRCCRRSGRFGICRFLRSSGLCGLYCCLFRCSRNEDFRRRGSRCIRCFRIGRRIAVRYVDTLSLHTELDGINIFSGVTAQFLSRNGFHRDSCCRYALRLR